MRLAFLVLVALAPLDACSDTFVTAPKPQITAPAATAPVPTILIRGAKVPQEVLIIVDGIVMRRGNFKPADIEQVEVIKGPSAATLYGDTRCPPIIIQTRRQSSVQEQTQRGSNRSSSLGEE